MQTDWTQELARRIYPQYREQLRQGDALAWFDRFCGDMGLSKGDQRGVALAVGELIRHPSRAPKAARSGSTLPRGKAR